MKQVNAILLAALLCLAACAVNPVTGGRDFVTMSEQQELALGRKSHQQILGEYSVYPNQSLQSYVQRVGQDIAGRSHRRQLVYRFTVLDSEDVNAFALPGGYIYITRGLLAYLNSEAELAAVLGHEIGHVTARHSVRQHSVAQTASIGATLGAIFIPQMRTQGASQLVNVLGTALLSGYGREHELEADRLGAEYLARAGYSPSAMFDVIKILKKTRAVRQEPGQSGRTEAARLSWSVRHAPRERHQAQGGSQLR